MRRTSRFLGTWTPVVLAVLVIRTFFVEAFMVPTGSMEDTILVGDFMLVSKLVYGVKLPFSNRIAVPVSRPRRGDIVVFRFPLDADRPQPETRFRRIFPPWLQVLPVFWDKERNFFAWYAPRSYIKRCVALAGDTVEYREKELYVNGARQDEPWVVHKDPRTLPGFDPLPAGFQQSWERGRFYQTELSPWVRDNFGPVVVPPGCIFAMGDNRDLSEDGRFWGPLELRHLRGRPIVTYLSSAAAPSMARVLVSPWALRLGRVGRLVR
jgi:signal peptidase I